MSSYFIKKYDVLRALRVSVAHSSTAEHSLVEAVHSPGGEPTTDIAEHSPNGEPLADATIQSPMGEPAVAEAVIIIDDKENPNEEETDVESQSSHPYAYAIVPHVAGPVLPLDYPARSILPIEMQCVIDSCISDYPGVHDVIISRGKSVLERGALEDILMNR
ncbi:uncharacterized protein LOC110018746 [Phalaenopsis equestris]|uniref:uncharacterized protein LOC110018746 n=1 Tax=Phalaenopsis equestris TaxID=78828 RepID=UPI0009E3CF80|nr:uncharacterized protein LOC110018746 [Phalaenopsis equestris]XP_020571822.1 uncharacterized protein LOC110018746 [Phalaenopsis equestris]